MDESAIKTASAEQMKEGKGCRIEELLRRRKQQLHPKKLNRITLEPPNHRRYLKSEKDRRIEPTSDVYLWLIALGGCGGGTLKAQRTLVIMQELQLMRKDMKEMRGDITNLSMEHKDQIYIGGHVTSYTQWGYGNFSPHARTFEHNSYDFMRAIDLELKMVIMINLIREFQGIKLEMKGIM
ncbi:hypothetical protein M9H77_23200 [Catharanthus roseus]|uniref:Uncharacterized protein n=1 Tax=Catharanthus roseus TaxID=4058 RepID=A0ACC0ATV3_CATRO|nr:hypothetical protein M9H77_23200 [Catharanthus roseus]